MLIKDNTQNVIHVLLKRGKTVQSLQIFKCVDYGVTFPVVFVTMESNIPQSVFNILEIKVQFRYLIFAVVYCFITFYDYEQYIVFAKSK